MSQILEKLPKIRGKYRQNATLKSWFDVGGEAEILFKPADIEDLAYFLKNCPKEIPITILGAASNVIISDGGIKGVVIRLGGEFAKIKNEGEVVSAGCAALCGSVALYCQNESLSKLEFLSGIPGSIGGALAMNAGCYGGDISQILISAKALDYDGNILDLPASSFNFSYRKNNISDKYIFVEAVLRAEKSTLQEVSQKIKELCENREKAQPIRAKTGGSTFKNPFPDDSSQKRAWQLIDEAGCRGASVGGAKMSEKHCNFMINESNAKASDLIALGELVKKKVKETSNVDLDWEIKVLGLESEK